MMTASLYLILSAGTLTCSKEYMRLPGKVKYLKKKYKVTSVGASALHGNRSVTTLTIGKNVKSIGKNAFGNCSSLTNVKIKTKSLKASKVGANAFKGSPVRNVKCPKSKKKAYKKFLTKKGISKSARIYYPAMINHIITKRHPQRMSLRLIWEVIIDMESYQSIKPFFLRTFTMARPSSVPSMILLCLLESPMFISSTSANSSFSMSSTGLLDLSPMQMHP